MLKRILLEIILALFATISVPIALFLTVPKSSPQQTNRKPEYTINETVSTPVETTVACAATVFVLENDIYTEMPLEDYVLGVVLGEMPATFHEEALKAQSIAARTFAVRRQERCDKHNKGGVCTNPACCQAYLSETDFLKQGGEAELLRKVRDCVQMTEGQIIMYNGEVIDATYFSCSGGRTENALEVFGMDVPYLQAIDSPGEENTQYYMETIELSNFDFCSQMGIFYDGNPINIDSITYTQGGGVAKIEINNTEFTGNTVRNSLGLRSTVFRLQPKETVVSITTKGFGHRVGMSQYGANAMAQNGNTCYDIISYYYPGTKISFHSPKLTK